MCLFCVCMCPKYSQTEGVFLPRELEVKKKEKEKKRPFNFPLEQISIYTHIPLRDSSSRRY